jgi:ribonuclease HII
MPLELHKLSIAEIRSRFLPEEATPVSGQVLQALKRDGRQGVQQVYETLKKRHTRERRESARLDGMLNFERVLWKTGVQHIAGVDEVGMGPLAGPVVAAAVVFAPGSAIPGVDDSKRLDAETRERLAEKIHGVALAVGIGEATVEEIDRINVYQAGLLAMRRAVEALPIAPQHVLVDARTIPGITAPQNPFTKGDGINYSIAAASIVAKTHRDRLMSEWHDHYPEYGFMRHKGYSTPEHQAAIRRYGPCTLHRMSYPFIQELRGQFSPRFYELRERLAVAHTATALKAVERVLKADVAQFTEHELRKLKLVIVRKWRLT